MQKVKETNLEQIKGLRDSLFKGIIYKMEIF